MQQITLNVTNLIKIIKEKNILFYPAIMHILLQAYPAKKEFVFYELEQKFLKTHFHSDFGKFYKNYIYDCYLAEPQSDISKGIVFALSEKSALNADFILLPLKQKQNQTFLSVIVNFDVDLNFETQCQQAVLIFESDF